MKTFQRLSFAAACVIALPANAQLLVHKDLTLSIATTIAAAAIESCKARGWNA